MKKKIKHKKYSEVNANKEYYRQYQNGYTLYGKGIPQNETAHTLSNGKKSYDYLGPETRDPGWDALKANESSWEASHPGYLGVLKSGVKQVANALRGSKKKMKPGDMYNKHKMKMKKKITVKKSTKISAPAQFKGRMGMMKGMIDSL